LSTTGTGFGVALPGKPALEDDAVALVDGVVDLQVVELEVACQVVVRDANQEQRHAARGSVLGRRLADRLGRAS